MSEWKEKSLAEIAENKAYAIVDGPFGTQLHASEYQKEGVPVVRVVNTTYDGRFDDRDLVYISETKANSLKRSKVIPGDVIIAKTGATIGKSGIFPSKYPRGIVASSCLKISVDTEKADNRFVARLIESHEGQRKIIDGAGGSTRTTINIKPFSAIRFAFPDDKDEQTQIAEILSTIDRAIEQTESIIEKQSRIKTGLMQDLLTKGIDEQGNIRSEETHEFKDSALGRIPADWKILPLFECVKEEITYGIVQAGPHIENGIPYIRTGDMSGDELSDTGLLKTSKIIAKSYKRSEVHTNDIAFALRATVGKVLLVPKSLNGANLTQGTAKISPNDGVSSVFLLWIMRDYRVTRQIEISLKGTTFSEITLSDLRKIKIPIPKTLEEQSKIEQILNSAEVTIKKHQLQRKKLMQIKEGLMQDLLNGRVPVTELMNKKREVQRVAQ